jgi:hypothetical protein
VAARTWPSPSRRASMPAPYQPRQYLGIPRCTCSLHRAFRGVGHWQLLLWQNSTRHQELAPERLEQASVSGALLDPRAFLGVATS